MDRSLTLPTGLNTSLDSSEVKELCFGRHCQEPMELYHGMDSGSTKPLECALKIIESGAIIPGGCAAYKDLNIDQCIFQHIAANLDNETVKASDRVEPLGHKISGKEYVISQKKTNTVFYNKILSHAQARFPYSQFLIPSGLMSKDPRVRTTCFTRNFGSYYSSHISFHFDLKEKQIKDLEAANYGGKSFYEKGSVVRCTQELSLKFATSIILGPELKNKEYCKARIKEDLDINGLSHIKVIDSAQNRPRASFTTQQKPFDPSYKTIFDLPFDTEVFLKTLEVANLWITYEGVSELKEYADSTFDQKPAEGGYLLTRRKNT